MTQLSAAEDQYCRNMRRWPRIEQAEPIDDGQAIAVLLREFDGTISAVRIAVEQLAD